MIRKHARLRREYLWRKAQEDKLRTKYETKEKIRGALAGQKKLPTELREAEKALRKEMLTDDPEHVIPTLHEDDEYANAGRVDPKLLLTTSRSPSSRLRQFAKELCFLFPNCQRMNRGGHVLKDLVDAARSNEVSDLIIVHETRGEPDTLIVSHMPYGPTAHFAVANSVLRHDIDAKTTVPQVYPHLIFEGFQTKLGLRITNILKHLFPVSKSDSKRLVSFVNDNDFIVVRHHMFRKGRQEDASGSSVDGEGTKGSSSGLGVDLDELGPRFELRPFLVQLGTVDVSFADNEYVLRPHLNTAAYHNQL